MKTGDSAPGPVSRRGLMALGATTGIAAAMPVRAATKTTSVAAKAGSSIDPASVQLLFADLQSPLVAGSKTQPPERLERAAAARG